jgi:16S rRNA (adenine1518-N6/adenine1519-N6)-dimethyltransferase
VTSRVTSRDPRVVLRGAGLHPKKALGQNFLVAEPIARAIAEACVPEGEVGRARVVEIGAGTGALTRWLAPRARELVAIERDRDLVPVLAAGLAELPVRVRVVEGDARTADVAALLGPPIDGSPRVLCGNLPYAITGPLLRLAVDVADSVDRVVFMVQDEVAVRLAAAPGGKDWAALTVFVHAAYSARRVLKAPPGAFHPPPAVTSAVLELLPLHPRRAIETPAFRAVVKAAFQARRKTLRNAWAGLGLDGLALAAAAERVGVNLDARGETLDVEAFARMAAEVDAAAPISDRR